MELVEVEVLHHQRLSMHFRYKIRVCVVFHEPCSKIVIGSRLHRLNPKIDELIVVSWQRSKQSFTKAHILIKNPSRGLADPSYRSNLKLLEELRSSSSYSHHEFRCHEPGPESSNVVTNPVLGALRGILLCVLRQPPKVILVPQVICRDATLLVRSCL